MLGSLPERASQPKYKRFSSCLPSTGPSVLGSLPFKEWHRRQSAMPSPFPNIRNTWMELARSAKYISGDDATSGSCAASTAPETRRNRSGHVLTQLWRSGITVAGTKHKRKTCQRSQGRCPEFSHELRTPHVWLRSCCRFPATVFPSSHST